MSNSSVVVTLVDRLTTRLPHFTGSASRDFTRDEVLILNRATIVGISTSSIGLVAETLVKLLEELARPYKDIQTHPLHILYSELYLLELLSECFSTHWTSVNTPQNVTQDSHTSGSESSGSENDSKASSHKNDSSRTKRASSDKLLPRSVPPKALSDNLVRRLIGAVKSFLRPLSDTYTIPTTSILDDTLKTTSFAKAPFALDNTTAANKQVNDTDSTSFLLEGSEAIEAYIRGIVEYISFSNWSSVFECLKSSLRTAHPASGTGVQANALVDDDGSLLTIRLMSSFWVDGRKLSMVINELCGSFLHLRKAPQTTIALVFPLLITRWLERDPEEFVSLHSMHRRLDGGADTLFHMAATTFEGARRKSLFYPFQTSLLLLQPDIFEVASSMRDVKSSSISKKVSFLETLRKSLRGRNEAAIYCLVTILRVARHFEHDSDAALLSFALDVQEEVREAVFRRYAAGVEATAIDSGLITAAFVSLMHLGFETTMKTLTPLCLAPNASQDYKVAAISACTHFSRQSNSEEYKPFYWKVAAFIHSLFQKISSKIRESSDEQYSALMALEAVSCTEIIYNILVLMDEYPLTIYTDALKDSGEWGQWFEDGFTSFMGFLAADDVRIRYLASSIMPKAVARLTNDGSISYWRNGTGSGIQYFKLRFWKSTSIILSTVSERLLDTDNNETTNLSLIHNSLETRLALLKSIVGFAELDREVAERASASTRLETAFLVCLCSSEISTCKLVTRCISIFCEEAMVIEKATSAAKSSIMTLRNADVYADISAKDFRFTGLVAFQKRVRNLLRQMRHPTTGVLTAWELIFEKWLVLSKFAISSPANALDEKSLVQWRNYSGFLASLSGTCISSQSLPPEELGLAGLRWIDRVSTESSDDTLLTKYMRQSVQLLASNNVRIREATRETLSTELPPSLSVPLFETLGSELGVLFDSPRTNTSLSIESRVMFAEQAASLLRSVVEKLGGTTEVGASSIIDIGVLTLNFAKFLDDLGDASGVFRVKIKICQLCETITQKRELLNLRHDVRIRNQLLEVIFAWIARPSSPKSDSLLSVGSRVDEPLRSQRDLDRACLKALADLTYRLPLQPAEGQTDADTSDLKSQMFHKYFHRFLSLFNYETTKFRKSEERQISAGNEELVAIPELAITALSNLLSANIDVGLKHSLAIGYHEDLDIRTAFVKVLHHILIQGTEFNSLSDITVNRKYNELLELLVNDMTLTIGLCDACPSTEVDEMTISLLNIFESRGLGFVLLEALIEHEVDETENEAELLRRNCVATKILSVYAKWKGAVYLKATLQKVLERLMLTSKDLDLELDPTRTTSAEELQRNALQLQAVTKVFLDDICNSTAHIPVSFRKICNIISSAVMRRFPDAKFTAVGAFIFLRFFCPAIVAPDAEGLISSTPSKEMRRGLLLIAKIVQNLANNVLFGAKEPYMFPLNDFLSQNIYYVATFLREISAPLNVVEPVVETESFDFGSCVALHRFLYDYWDHVRQKLVLRERRGGSVLTRYENANGEIPILEALRKLISNLGPPPMDISWNRPSISFNIPPSYSRFQHFMLRNAGRNTDLLVSSRAVYDGGESKDGLPMICIILRNIDTETTDYELLLFGYLKIASRMWHRPFGIVIDATCYNGQNEPQDALFQNLELLTPRELSKQLSQIYVYNMNSAFRKCFRRILRLSAKNEDSAFHPNNVDYHLIGNLQDFQTHFHLSQLHLPKETLSVVTDTRYQFQPITRLSKTKGKIEVIIKVGSQFVQVTTMMKQEIIPGLRLHATVNDIFRLSEVDEVTTAIQTEDDSAFGLRTENGKIVMYFTSPRKPDVLKAIRTAKAKYGKEQRTLKSFERLVRPQDVPGTLLNIALSNMASTDQVLRLAAYNLLCALCDAFKFAASSKFMSAKELCVPLNPSNFIIDISKQLAQSEPQLTADFLTEFFVGWKSFSYSQQPLSLVYMAAWLPNLRTSLISNESDTDKAREKVALIFRKLIEVAISDVVLSTTLEQSVWPVVRQDEIYVEIFLDEVIKSALSFGIDDEHTEILGSIVASLGTVSIRGKLLSRLRKALNRTSLRPTKQLPENTVWNEISILLHLCLSISFESGIQSQLFVPEIFHLVTMLANTGPPSIRLTVHRLLVNTIHAMCTTFGLEETKLAKLKQLLQSLSEPKQDSLFNISTHEKTSLLPVVDTSISILNATESLAVLLSKITIIGSPSVDMSNVWRSRWMSLVASTAFQSNPAIQPRAFTVMGCLAREEVDDDLLYQVLVALRNSIGRFMDDSSHEMLISIITSLTKMMDKLPSTSRYGLQLFWLAMSLVRLVPQALFNCAILFLEAVLANIARSGEFAGGRMIQTLLHGRVPLEDAALQLDEIYGIHFNEEDFHFAVSACLVKGLTDSATRSTTLRVYLSFLDITGSSLPPGVKYPDNASCLPYAAMIVSRSINDKEATDALSVTGVPMQNTDGPFKELYDGLDISWNKDKELLLNTAIALVDFRYLDDTVQNRGLYWLNKLASKRPSVVLHLCGPLLTILDEVLTSCQSTATLETAHELFRSLTANPKFSSIANTTEMMDEVLEGIGFGGLWRSSSFHMTNDILRQCAKLTDRLIEFIIA